MSRTDCGGQIRSVERTLFICKELQLIWRKTGFKK